MADQGRSAQGPYDARRGATTGKILTDSFSLIASDPCRLLLPSVRRKYSEHRTIREEAEVGVGVVVACLWDEVMHATSLVEVSTVCKLRQTSRKIQLAWTTFGG